MRILAAVLVLANLLLLGAGWVLPDGSTASRAAESTDPADAPSLQLLSEAGAPAAGERAGSDERQLDPDRAELPALCTLLGPFADRAAADPVLTRLQSLDLPARVGEVEISDGPGYWVHLPPELSRQAALERLHELQGEGVDSYVIPRGELANGISFGMFSRQSLARERRDELRAQGYDAQIRQIERSHREFWVAVPARRARSVSESVWERLSRESPDLERRQNFCPGVASG